MSVRKYLDVSTSHLSLSGRIFLANPEKHSDSLVVYPKNYGWIILYWDNGYRNDIPSCLRAVFNEAEKQGCDLVILDRDAEVLAGLPTYRPC